MVNVFDTHRMLYRNAVLRAYDKANPTTRIDFYNNDVNVGNEVYTNENGYLFYESGGRQIIECLNVDGDAIIKVSLDGGNSFSITWEIDDETAQYAQLTDIHDMTYRGNDGIRKRWDPTQADCTLPDYLLKNEYQNGIWGEQEIAIGAGMTSLTLAEWAHVITITTTAPNTITITNVRLRAGQSVHIIAKKVCTLAIRTGIGPAVNHSITANHTYVLINNYGTENSDAGLQLFDITYNSLSTTDVENIVKEVLPIRDQKNIYRTQSDAGQVYDFTSEFPDGLSQSPIFIWNYIPADLIDVTINLPSANFNGSAYIIVEHQCAIELSFGSPFKLQVGNSNIISATIPKEPGRYSFVIRLVAWQDATHVRHHMLYLET